MPRVGLIFTIALVAGLNTQGYAQDIRWRHDYAAARKEAAASGRPLLLDFGTENCFWCKKLDATTFRVASVARTISERVIPVKIDADQQAWLTQAAGVESYPTLVLLAPDGKVIARHVGYADTAKMTAFLGQLPAAVPAQRSAQAELLAAARADHDAGRFLACVSRCDQLAAEFPNTPEAALARQLMVGIAADPEKWKRVTGQVEADLAALRRNLDASLNR